MKGGGQQAAITGASLKLIGEDRWWLCVGGLQRSASKKACLAGVARFVEVTLDIHRDMPKGRCRSLGYEQ